MESKGPTNCCLQAGEPGKPVVQFSPSVISDAQEQEKMDIPAQKGREKLPFIHLFVPIDRMMPAHIAELRSLHLVH